MEEYSSYTKNSIGGPRLPRTERRARRRVGLPEPLAVRLKGHLPARLVDLSGGGALAEVGIPLVPARELELVIPFPDAPFVALATVRRCQAFAFASDVRGGRNLVYRAGLEFAPVSARAAMLLEHELAFLDAGPPLPVPGEAERAAIETARRSARAGGPVRIRVGARPAS